MGVKLPALHTYLLQDVRPRNDIPTPMQYERCVKEAIADFGRQVPLKKQTVLDVVSGTATYTLPTDFLFVIDLESLTIAGDGDVVITPAGIIPLAASFRERYTIAQGQITFVPDPTYTCERRLWYGAFYELDATDQEYKDLDEVLVGSLMHKARALAYAIKAGAAAEEAWSYSIGDERVSKEKLAMVLRAQADKSEKAYAEAVQLHKGPSGLRSSYEGQVYDGLMGVQQ